MIFHLRQALRPLIFLFSTLLLGAIATLCLAEDKNIQQELAEISSSLDQIESELKRKEKRLDRLDTYLEQLPGVKNWAQQCLDSMEISLQRAEKGLAALGEPTMEESTEAKKKRQSLQREKSELQKTYSSCQVILLRSEESITIINDIRKEVLQQHLLARGPNFFTLLSENLQHPAIWFQATKDFIKKNSGLETIGIQQLLLLLLTIGITLGTGLYLKTLLNRRIERHPPTEEYASRVLAALLITLRQYTPYILTSLGVAIFFYFSSGDIKPVPFINIVAYGLPIVITPMALIHLFLHAAQEVDLIQEANSKVALVLARRLKILVLLVFIGYLLLATILAQSLPESALLLVRGVFGVILVLNLIWAIWLISQFQRARRGPLIRITFSLFLIGALVAEWLGYRNLSDYLLRIIVGTTIVLLVFHLIGDFVRDELDRLEQGEAGWQRKIHQWLGIKPGVPLPGVTWLRIIAALGIWTGLIFTVLLIWGLPESQIAVLFSYITGSFSIGSFEIYPLRILQAILVLVVLLALNGWFRKRLDKEWLAKTRMERGARESISTITGYIGIAVAILIALGVAGMDFTKLAIIAGALSLGIGFGLQNIVNNFVSGLILLFERPIKTGDWIEVAGIEGHVKKISIRSTLIETFDQADVIVPNSELIAGNLTNWMLHNMRGRIRVPVGVAYGTDTEKVKELLLQVANEHPDVIKEGTIVPEPRVLFMSFGESSLDFELRCFVQNIDRRRSIISDLNFAIDAIFREHDIEIPFPQRDIHIVDSGKTTGGEKDISADKRGNDS